MPRVGVFGGSFNPIHFGHLLLADQIVELLRLDQILFVPAAEPPHKPAAELAPAADRLHMTALAVGGHPRFETIDLELRRAGPSYTIDTLTALADRGTLYLVIGSDTFLDLLAWRDPRGVATRARLVVVPRSGGGFDPDAPDARKVLSELGLTGFVRLAVDGDGPPPVDPSVAVVAEVTSLPLSGSDLRRRAREGRSLAYRMPEAVAAYIRTRRLYGGAAP